LDVKPYIDIWSFGCVCSEAAVWIVRGWNGLDQYRRRRAQETGRIPDFRDPSAFHGGERVLPAVANTHSDLLELQQIRPCDHVTRPTLNMVTEMLEEVPEERPKAKALWRKSQHILEDARKKVGSPVLGNSNMLGNYKSVHPELSLPQRPETPTERPTGIPHSHSSPSTQGSGLRQLSSLKQHKEKRSATFNDFNQGQSSDQNMAPAGLAYENKFAAIDTISSSPTGPPSGQDCGQEDEDLESSSSGEHSTYRDQGGTETDESVEPGSPSPPPTSSMGLPATLKGGTRNFSQPQGQSHGKQHKKGHRPINTSITSNSSNPGGLFGPASEPEPIQPEPEKMQLGTNQLPPQIPPPVQPANQPAKVKQEEKVMQPVKPALSLGEAKKYISDRKAHKPATLPHAELRNELEKRDHVRYFPLLQSLH